MSRSRLAPCRPAHDGEQHCPQSAAALVGSNSSPQKTCCRKDCIAAMQSTCDEGVTGAGTRKITVCSYDIFKNGLLSLSMSRFCSALCSAFLKIDIDILYNKFQQRAKCRFKILIYDKYINIDTINFHEFRAKNNTWTITGSFVSLSGVVGIRGATLRRDRTCCDCSQERESRNY